MKKSVFLSATKALYKKEEADVADHLKTVEGEEIDDTLVVDIFKKLDAEKVTGFKTEATTRFNNGVSKGVKETAKKFETKLKSVFNIEDDTLEGDELLNHIEENLPQPGQPGNGKLDLSKISAEDLLKIPAFINAKKQFDKQLKEKDTEKEKAVQEEQAKQTDQQIKTEAVQKALGMLDAKNPILPKDAGKATTMKNRLLADEIKAQKFMKDDNGELIPLDAEGKQATDAQGNPLDFNTLVESIMTNNFEFNIVNPRTSPANKAKPGSGAGGDDKKVWTGKAPANQQEYTELLVSDDYDSEEKTALKEAYGTQFGN